jgi:hypothetical protein
MVTNLHLAFYPNFPGNLDFRYIGLVRRLPRDHIDLSRNTALQSITLHPGEVILTAIEVLSKICSNDMEQVAIIVTLPMLTPDPNGDSLT